MITINGINIEGLDLSGKNVQIKGNRIIVNGKDVTPDSKEINISIQGNVQDLKVDCCDKIEITGIVNEVKTQSGDVEVKGDIKGNVQTMSGDVDCGNILGSVSTMSGDIKHRK